MVRSGSNLLAVLILSGIAMPSRTSCLPGLQWNWSNPIPTGNNFIGLAFDDSSRGRAVSDLGEAVVTRDGGRTWELKAGRIDSGNLIAVDARHKDNLIGCSAQGRIWKSADGGNTWRVVGAAPGTLFDIRHCGDGIALAVGAGGAIVRSGDSGMTWTLVRSEILGAEVLGVDCAAGRNAYAAGRDGLLLRSRDRGATWDTLPPPSGRTLTRILFADSARGLITTENGSVLRTGDGGKTWRTALLDSLVFLRGLAWEGPNALVSGSDGGLWASRDDGMTWSRAPSTTAFFLQEAGFHPSGSAVVVGDGGVILTSPDGTAWQRRDSGPPENWMGLAVIGPGNWLAFGTEGRLLKTADGGKSWEGREADSAFYLAGAFRGAHGALTTAEGGILFTTDEGGSWLPAGTPPIPASGLLYGVDFADSTTAVAVGDSGTLWRSRDGGRSWKAVTAMPPLDTIGLNAVGFPSPGSGIIVGDAGTILASSDGGASWSRVAAPVATDLFGLAFRDRDAGVAVGRAGIVLWTRDGGLTWEKGSTGQYQDLLVYAAWMGVDSALVLGISGHEPVIRFTSDRGKTWQKVDPPTRSRLWSLKGVSDGQAVFLGEKGAILIATLQHGVGPGRAPLPYPGGISVQRTGIGPRALITLPRSARFRITTLDLNGKSLARSLFGEMPAGRHTLVLPRSPKPGPVIYLLESADAGTPFRFSSLLPY